MDQKLDFVYPNAFNKKWIKLNLTEKDKKDMESQIAEFEKNDNRTVLGSIIKGTNGAIKWRFSGEDLPKGKSGSNRIVYFVYSNKTYYFLDIYAKGKKETLTNDEKKMIKKFITDFKRTLKRHDKLN